MDHRRAQALVKLAHGVAELGKDAARKLEARRRPLARLHVLGERLARDQLHHHHEVAVAPVALEQARQVREPHATGLRREDLLVGAAQPGFATDALANEGPQLGAVLAAKEHALGSLERAVLEHRVNAVAVVAREGVEIGGKFVVGVHAPILAERDKKGRGRRRSHASAPPGGVSPLAGSRRKAARRELRGTPEARAQRACKAAR